jgi:hypothetical protein
MALPRKREDIITVKMEGHPIQTPAVRYALLILTRERDMHCAISSPEIYQFGTVQSR